MVIAALYMAVMVVAVILLGILWAAYKGTTYLWRQWLQTDKQIGQNEVNETVTK